MIERQRANLAELEAYKGTDPAVLECSRGAFVLKGTLREGGRVLVTKAP